VDGDGEMVRSEEELQVDVRRREPTCARLRKYVVSEPVEETVTIQREQAHLEREPVTGPALTAAGAAPELAEEEREVVLGDEEAVVEKRVVPKERVRLGKEVIESRRRSAGSSARRSSSQRARRARAALYVGQQVTVSGEDTDADVDREEASPAAFTLGEGVDQDLLVLPTQQVDVPASEITDESVLRV
jgi:hypothetical protein